jgi:hypothetical protein
LYEATIGKVKRGSGEMSKRPTKVNVLGVPFSIEYVADLKASDGDTVMGETLGEERTIRICTTKNKNQELVEAVILHEIIHAALYISGQTERLGDKHEESLVLALENALAPIYRRRF